MKEQDLGQIIPDFTATATIDNSIGTPEVNVTIEELEELGRLITKLKFNFLHLKGDKPQKGVDYYTPQEKEQFTTETKALVAGEGTKQISLINAETAKVINQVKEIVAGNAATTNALTLNGKTRLEFEKEIQGVAGGYNGTFPLTKATLNGIYLLPATGKFYVCTKEYNGTNLTAPNGNFEELSAFKNKNRLDNLKGICISKVFTKKPTKLGIGLWLLYRLHNGYYPQSKLYIFSLTGYEYTPNNKFYHAPSLIPNSENSAYSLEFNPVTCEIKMVDDQTDETALYYCINLDTLHQKL